MITKVIKLDINKNLYEKIKAKQGDTKSRFLLFQLLDGSMPFNLENRSVRAYMLKPDSTEVFNDLIINNRNTGHCTLELTNQVLAVAGIVKIELMIIENDKKITSSIFELQVDKSINSENSIVSTNEFNALLNGLASLSEYDNYKEKAKKVPELEENIQELGSQLEQMENNISILKSEKYLFIGDSYGMGYTPEGIVKNWCQYTKELMNIKDENYYHYAVGGYGFTNDGFQTLLNKAITEIQDKENVKYVIVGGGYNDAKTYNMIADGMQTFFNTCKPNFTNAKIIIAPFGWCIEGLTTDVHADQKISNLINMVLEYQRNAVIQGGCYIDGIYSVLHNNSFFSSDFVHPNNNGEYAIGLAIANYLKGNTFNTVEYMKTENCFANNVYENGINNTIQCVATVDCKSTVLNLTSGKITGTFNNVTLNGNSILLGTIKSAAINGCYNKIVIPLKGILKTTENKFYSIDFTLFVSNNKLYMNLTMINDDNLDFKTLSFTEINVMTYSSPITINSLIN